ncbi:MAG: lipid-A-disaccharide synthase [Cyclobacteriaceae bacterium]|nr:lipid-A-disaccharide synthase [Cyclobacteriaceae bacterium SS2]
MRYFVIAGERSGDMHAARLIGQLKKQDPNAEIIAWGGDMMQAEGAKLLQHYREISFMGLWEVIKNLRVINKKLSLCKSHISKHQPDVLILVDFPGFNLRMAEYGKSIGLKTCYYISPKIWAWKEGRIKKIRQFVDQMLVILPFETAFYKRLDYPVKYVGNPLVESIAEYNYDFSGLEELKNADNKRVAVLPGSRSQEVEKAISVINQLAIKRPEILFLVAGVDNLPPESYQEIGALKNVSIHYNKTYELLKLADVAIVTSGTATLETAIVGTLQVVVYKTSWLTYLIGRMLVKIQFISLVNLIAGKRVVEELIQSAYNAETILNHIELLLHDESTIKKMRAGYTEISEKLGQKKAAQNAASEIIAMLK